jgi:hypothetical protein
VGQASTVTESSAEISSTSASTVALTTGIIASSTSSPVSDDGLHPGYAALIAVVVVCAVIAIVIATVFIVSRRRRAAAASAAAAAGAGAMRPQLTKRLLRPSPRRQRRGRWSVTIDDSVRFQTLPMATTTRSTCARSPRRLARPTCISCSCCNRRHRREPRRKTKTAIMERRNRRQRNKRATDKNRHHIQAGTEYDHVAEIDHRGNGSDAPTYDRVRGRSKANDDDNGRALQHHSADSQSRSQHAPVPSSSNYDRVDIPSHHYSERAVVAAAPTTTHYDALQAKRDRDRRI